MKSNWTWNVMETISVSCKETLCTVHLFSLYQNRYHCHLFCTIELLSLNMIHLGTCKLDIIQAKIVLLLSLPIWHKMSLYLKGICLCVYVIYVINVLYVHESRMFKNFNRLKALCQSWGKSYQLYTYSVDNFGRTPLNVLNTIFTA